MFNKILVPYDGSEVSKVVLPFASQLAQELGASLLMLTVIDRRAVDATSSQYAEFFQKAEDTAREHLKGVADDLNEKGVTASYVIATGRAGEEIVSVAEREECGLIAISTHGRSPVTRGVLGSVTDEVVHASDVPVITLTPEKATLYRDHEIDLSRIMVGLDGTPFAERSLPYVERLAKDLDMEVTLVQVVQPFQSFWMDTFPANLKAEEKELREAARSYLEATAERLIESGLKVDWKVMTGHPAASIIDLAADTPHDVIAIATRGRSGFARWALGSVAEAVVRGTGDPVLIIPPPRVDGES